MKDKKERMKPATNWSNTKNLPSKSWNGFPPCWRPQLLSRNHWKHINDPHCCAESDSSECNKHSCFHLILNLYHRYQDMQLEIEAGDTTWTDKLMYKLYIQSIGLYLWNNTLADKTPIIDLGLIFIWIIDKINSEYNGTLQQSYIMYTTKATNSSFLFLTVDSACILSCSTTSSCTMKCLHW